MSKRYNKHVSGGKQIMQNKQFKYSLLGASVAAVMASVAPTAFADDAADGRVERILVTANRIAQDVQEVSSAITANNKKAI